jgi:hypothetical protein
MKTYIQARHGSPRLWSQLLGKWKQEEYEFEASLGKVSETLISKAKYKQKGWGVTQEVEHLPSMLKALVRSLALQKQ